MTVRYRKSSLRDTLTHAANGLIAQSADNQFLRLVVQGQSRELVIARNAAEVMARRLADRCAEMPRRVCYGSVLLSAAVFLPGGVVLGMLARGVWL